MDARPSLRMSRLRAQRVVAAAQRLSPRDASYYLQHSGVAFLLEDLVKRLQEERAEQPGVFLAAYWASVARGANVRGREFEYVNGTLQNRTAFVAQLQRGLSGVDLATEISSEDFAEIVWSRCSDVPATLLNQASSHLNESPDGAVRATLQNFVAAFAACFIYNEFLAKVHDAYNELMRASQSRGDASPSPSSAQSAGRSDSIASAIAADRVVARLRLLVQQSSTPVPPLADVESFVFKSSSFREFCSLFFLSPAIAATLHELQVAFAALSGSECDLV